jgi:hypothetical protein
MLFRYVGRSPWMGDQTVTLPVTAQHNTPIFVPLTGFKTAITFFGRPKTALPPGSVTLPSFIVRKQHGLSYLRVCPSEELHSGKWLDLWQFLYGQEQLCVSKNETGWATSFWLPLNATVFSLLSKSRRMRSSCCLCVCDPPLTFACLNQSLWNVVCIPWNLSPSQRHTSQICPVSLCVYMRIPKSFVDNGSEPGSRSYHYVDIGGRDDILDIFIVVIFVLVSSGM